MTTRSKIAKTLKKEAPYLKNEFGISKIALFGSVAKNKQQRRSDVDILVEFEKPLGLKFFDLADYLEKVLRKKIDILTAEGLKSIRISEVAKSIRNSLFYV